MQPAGSHVRAPPPSFVPSLPHPVAHLPYNQAGESGVGNTSLPAANRPVRVCAVSAKTVWSRWNVESVSFTTRSGTDAAHHVESVDESISISSNSFSEEFRSLENRHDRDFLTLGLFRLAPSQLSFSFFRRQFPLIVAGCDRGGLPVCGEHNDEASLFPRRNKLPRNYSVTVGKVGPHFDIKVPTVNEARISLDSLD
ncbi:hypothetical protein G5I_06073 [Acromyrmex echinatior]|uniref:Uncharacterized protein n=1 Tax=Acromyrmex echinatior TaxID=103372 RepID=F4WK30_ACREC|nr:hypothetical protein G5I_06073 [Acromyrmex echinatior]